MKPVRFAKFFVLYLAGVASLLAFPAAAAERPKLVLMITVDQLRGDIPIRFAHRFGSGGFRYLLDNGVYYSNAHYQHATNFTAVGHATLATGGNGQQHGLAGNDWHDFATGKQVYCVEDDRYNIISREKKAHEGISPRNLTSTTIGDELVIATGKRARVFSVSIKDRGAILPGGHLGKAFWFSTSTGEFVTSTYYYEDYPEWVKAWNKEKRADRYRDKTWSLSFPEDTYVNHIADTHERPYGGLSKAFPKPMKDADPKKYYGALRFTPFGDEVTLDFALELLRKERLGQGPHTDMLAISFSVTDYIGHAHGIESVEYEDNIIRLDRTLEELFKNIDRDVGLANTLIFLSSDHGMDMVPENKAELGYEAGRHYPEKFLAAVNAGLQKRYNTTEPLVVAFWNPSLYLNLDLVKKLGLEVSAVEDALREEILKVPGVDVAVTRTQLLKGDVPNNPIMNKVQRSFHSKRSGNVTFVQDQYWYLYPKAEEFAGMHGSPYSYDTYVPIVFAGPNIKPQKVTRLVAPEDIASTVAQILGTVPPSGSVGTPLVEVLGERP